MTFSFIRKPEHTLAIEKIITDTKVDNSRPDFVSVVICKPFMHEKMEKIIEAKYARHANFKNNYNFYAYVTKLCIRYIYIFFRLSFWNSGEGRARRSPVVHYLDYASLARGFLIFFRIPMRVVKSD